MPAIPFPGNVISSSEAGAQVVVEEITFDDNAGRYIETDGIFTNYEVTSHYERDRHRYMLGITSPGGFAGDSVAFVQLAAPTLLWVVEWTASKLLAQPEVPAPTSVDARWVILDEHVDLPKITVAPDGVTPLYTISGVYVYGCRNPSPVIFTDTIFPRPPWLQDAFQRTISPGKVVGGIIDRQGRGIQI